MSNQLISDEPKTPIQISIGEEFVAWAEQYWNLKNTYTKTALESDKEQLTYIAVRDCFVKKIDSIISKRLASKI